MKRPARAVLALFLATTTLAAIAQESGKFRSSGTCGALPCRYRIHIRLMPGDDPDMMSRQLAATYGGRLDPYAAIGFVGFAIVTSETRARLLSSDARVTLVEEMPSPPVAVEPAPTVTMAQVASEGVPPRKEVGIEAISGFGTYTYDGSGNIISIGDVQGKDTFIYDKLGRLESATLRDGPGQTLTYDRWGNILTVVTAGDSVTKKLGVNKSTNRIDQTLDDNGQPNTEVGSYDGRGNLVSYGSGSFVYDGLDRVKEATVAGKRRFFVYTAGGERIASISVVGATTETNWTLRDSGGRVLRRFKQTNGVFAWTEDYIYRGSFLLAGAVPGSEKVRHFHLDHLGTPRLITGNGGAQIAQHHYQPFGPELPSSTATSSNYDEKAKFTGHERDASTLDYMHARYYDATIGRFLSVDPARGATPGAPQSWNRYAYAKNNPIAFIDADGRDATDYRTLQVRVHLVYSNADQDPLWTSATLRQRVEAGVAQARDYFSKMGITLAVSRREGTVFANDNTLTGVVRTASGLVDAQDFAQANRGKALTVFVSGDISLSGGAHGGTRFEGGSQLFSILPKSSNAGTLAHEIAHALGNTVGDPSNPTIGSNSVTDFIWFMERQQEELGIGFSTTFEGWMRNGAEQVDSAAKESCVGQGPDCGK